MTTITSPTGPPPLDDRTVQPSVKTSVTINETFVQMRAMALRAIIKTRRRPDQWVDVTVMPLMLTALFGFMFGGAIAGGLTKYLPLLIPGIIAQTCISACVAAGVQLRRH